MLRPVGDADDDFLAVLGVLKRLFGQEDIDGYGRIVGHEEIIRATAFHNADDIVFIALQDFHDLPLEFADRTAVRE